MSKFTLNNTGFALATVLIIIFIMTILAGIMLSMMSSQTMIVEGDISRIKSKYANEAAMVKALDWARTHGGNFSGTPGGYYQIGGKYDDAGQHWDVDAVGWSGSSVNPQSFNLTTEYTSSF